MKHTGAMENLLYGENNCLQKGNPCHPERQRRNCSAKLKVHERFLRDLTKNRIRRGVFHSVPELITAIANYLQHHNQHAKPFILTAKASDILEKVKLARRLLDKGLSA